MKLAIGNAIGVPFRAGFVSKYMTLNLPLISGLDSYFPTVKINEFDGVDDYVDLGTQIKDYLTVLGDYSIEIGIKYTGNDGMLFSSTISSSNRLGMRVSTGQVRLGHYNGSAYSSASSIAMINNTENKILMINTSGTITGYLNDVIMDGTINPVTNTTVGSVIGGLTDLSTLFKGNIDYVKIWSDATQTTLIASYDLKNSSYGKDQVQDLSGNGNHGTSYGKGEFSRSTDGTFTDHNGVIQTAGIDIARHEGQRWINDDKGGSEYVGENAIEFDGVDESVFIPFSSSLAFENNDEISICALINTDTILSTHGILGQGTEIILRQNSDDIEFILNSFSTNDRATATNVLESNKNILVFGIYDGTNINIYIDGVLKDSVTPTGTYGGDTGTWKIGQSGSISEFFDGLIDNPIIWNTALTGEEVFQQYQYSKKDSDYLVQKENVVSAWKLDDNSSEIIDYIGDNNGTFYSGGVASTPTLTEGVYDSDTRIPSDTLKGLMSYEGATNLVTYSEELATDWNTSRVTISVSENDSPINGVKYKTLLANNDGTQGTYGLDRNITGLTDNTNYTHSIYAKYVDIQWLRLTIITKANSTRSVWFDLLNGIVGTEDSNVFGKITKQEEYGYRCEIYTDIGTGATTPRFFYRLAGADNSDSFTGDGTQKIDIIGAMLNTGSFAMPYIKTTCKKI